MSGHTLHVQLSDEAMSGLVAGNPSRNRAGETLHDWIIRSFDSIHTQHLFNPTLFGAAFEVERETPLLLEALAQVQNATPEAIIEAWLLQPHTQQEAAVSPGNNGVGLDEATQGKLAEIIDLGETLFESMVHHAQHKLGGEYPEGEKAAQTSAELFHSMRVLIGLRMHSH